MNVIFWRSARSSWICAGPPSAAPPAPPRSARKGGRGAPAMQMQRSTPSHSWAQDRCRPTQASPGRRIHRSWAQDRPRQDRRRCITGVPRAWSLPSLVRDERTESISSTKMKERGSGAFLAASNRSCTKRSDSPTYLDMTLDRGTLKNVAPPALAIRRRDCTAVAR